MFGSIRFDFELLHYSACVSFRVMGGREHVRTETLQDAFVLIFQKIVLLAISKELLRSARVPRNTFSTFRESKEQIIDPPRDLPLYV
jgi:hypothetical protein